MTEAAEIRRAIKRTQRFRDWFKRTVPQHAVELGTILDDPTQHHKNASEVARSKPASKLVSCGTVGCVMGWLRVFPDMKRRATDWVGPYEYLNVWSVGDDSIFDPHGRDEPKNQKVAAIQRLNKHVKDLRKFLKEVA